MRRLFRRVRRLPWWGQGLLALAGLIGAGIGSYAALTVYSQLQSNSAGYIRRWFDSTANRPGLTTARRVPCPGAPFVLPSDGLIGLLWRDPAAPYNVFRRHTGLDIFGDGESGSVPVYAAYEGYLTRQPGWVSTVIIRHEDPLVPGRTIWTYYTHMASEDGDESYIVDDFPPGMSEVWVEQGALIGYQGLYAGSSLVPIGMHLHFSIVQSEPDGTYKNEAQLGSTLDPSPYLGMALNIKDRPARPIQCDTTG